MGSKWGNTARPRRNKAAQRGGRIRVPSLAAPGFCRAVCQRPEGKTPTLAPKCLAFGHLGAPQHRDAQPLGGGGPGAGTKGGEPSSLSLPDAPLARPPGAGPRPVAEPH